MEIDFPGGQFASGCLNDFPACFRVLDMERVPILQIWKSSFEGFGNGRE
jgi:hypothetical protein